MQSIISFKSGECLTPMLQKEIGNQMLKVVEKLGVQDYEIEKIRSDLEDFFSEIEPTWLREHPECVEILFNKIIDLADLKKPGGHIPYELILTQMANDPQKYIEILTSEKEKKEIIGDLGIKTSSEEDDYSDGNRDVS